MSRSRALALGLFGVLGLLLLVVVLSSGNATAANSAPQYYVGDAALAQAQVDGYCTGSGTAIDPYVFVNYTIDCTGAGYGIWMKNTDAFVVISNCTFFNSVQINSSAIGAGIILDNCCNVTVSECAFSNCANGIWSVQSDSCTYLDNDLDGINGIGINIESSNVVETAGNFKDQTGGTPIYGILVAGSHYVTINDTSLEGCQDGLALLGFSSYVMVDNATLHGQTQYGIYLQMVSNVSITNSSISGIADYGWGIYGDRANYVQIGRNTLDIQGDYASGIFLSDGNDLNLGNNIINDTVYAIYISGCERTLIEGNLCTNASDFVMRLSIVNGSLNGNVVRDSLSGIFLQNAQDMMVCDNDVTPFNDLGIYLDGCQNITVDGNSVAFTSNSFNKHIFVSSSSDCRITNNTMSGFGNTGIYVTGGTGFVISGNQISMAGDHGLIGINLVNAGGFDLMDNNIAAGMDYGLLVGSVHDLYVSSNVMAGTSTGIEMENCYDALLNGNDCNSSMVRGINIKSGGSSSNITLLDNFCVGSDTGILVDSIGGVVVEGNHCSMCMNAGIYFSESSLCYVGNNTATDCGTGLVFYKSPGGIANGGNLNECAVGMSIQNDGVTISNVTASHCLQYGLYVYNAVYTQISNSAFNWNTYGVVVFLDDTHDQPIYIRDCSMENNLEHGLDATGGWLVDVSGNHFANNLGYAIYLRSSCDSWMIYNNTFLDNNMVFGIDEGNYQAFDAGIQNQWYVWMGDRNYGNGWSNLPNVDLNQDGYVDSLIRIGGSYQQYQYQLPYGPEIGAPGAPTGLTASAMFPFIQLNWTAPDFDGNATVIDYMVYMGTTSGALYSVGTSWGELSFLISSELANGNIYYFAVKAINVYEFYSELSGEVEFNYTFFPEANFYPIIIHSDQEFADASDLYGWAGDGSQAYPYIIEDLVIDGSNWEDAVEIWDTTSFFIFRNCTFYFGTLGMTGNGVDLLNVVNGRFINCTFSGMMLTGIFAQNSQFSVEECLFNGSLGTGVSGYYSPGMSISDSTFTGASTAIYLFDSEDVAVIGNTFTGQDYGIYFDLGSGFEMIGNTAYGGRLLDLMRIDHATIMNNLGVDVDLFMRLHQVSYVTVTNNTADGTHSLVGLFIYLSSFVTADGNLLSDFDEGIGAYSSQQLIVQNNALSLNNVGLFLDSITDCNVANNEISGNFVFGMQVGHDVTALMVERNLFGDSTGYGVYIEYSADAILTLNIFIGNNGNDGTYSTETVQAFDAYLSCQWSYGGYGNLWADWTSPDDDGDGIVDIGYGDGENVLDQFPLVHAFGVPTVTIEAIGPSWVFISWGELSYNFTGGVTGYRIYRSLDGSFYTLLDDVTGNEYNATGLTLGTTYFFRVAAYLDDEEGIPSAPVLATPCNVPGAPTGLRVESGIRTLTLTWDAPTDDGGAEITGYEIWRGTSPTTLMLLIVIPAEMLEYGDGSLGDGAFYYYVVRAVNQAGPGTASATVGNSTFALPGTPLNLATQFGDGNVTVTWDAPADDGGTPISGYVIEVSYLGGTGYYYPEADDRSWLVNGLTNREEYSFRVRAANGVGPGSWTSPVNDTPATVPDPPTGLSVTPGEGSITLFWLAPAGDGGDAVASYRVYRWNLDTAWTLIATVTGLTYQDSAVDDGTLYKYRVTAVNKAGEGAASEEVTVVPGLPLAPTGLTAVNSGGDVLLNWTAPADDGGSAVIDYKVYRDGGSGFVYIGHTGSSALTYLDGTATPGVDYRYRVSAVTLKGEGVPSNEAAITLPLVSPEAPVIDTAVQGDDGVLLIWHLPESSTVPDQFLLYRGATPDGLLLIAVIDGDLREYLDVTGTAGTFYALRSSNEYGIGNLSEVFQATLGIILPPEAPQGLSAMAGDSLVTLSWTASDGAVGYHVFRDDGSGYVLLDTVSGTGYADDSVINGVAYSYRLTAYMDGGESGNSTTVMATPGSVPGAVRDLTLVEGEGLVTLSWLAPAEDGGSAVLGYRVFRELNGTVVMLAMVSSLTFGDHDLINGLKHTYWVVALNAWGAGPESARVNITPEEIVVEGLPAPAYLLATVGNGSVVLTWDPMSSFAVDGFRVFRSDGTNLTFLIAQPGSSYTDTGLVNGVAYTYVVYAFIGTANGENATVTAVPGTVPGAATLNGQVAVDRITLGWSVPESNGAQIIGYRLYRTPGTGTKVLLASLTGNGYVDTAVLAGVNYTYMVTALNAFGEGAPSNLMVLRTSQQVAPSVDVPAEPYLSTATGGNTSVSLLWNVPSDTGDGPITGYNVYRGTSPLAVQLLVSVPAGTTTYVDGTAVFGTTYYYCVSALNQWGESEPSRVLSASLIVLAVPGEVDVEVDEGQGRITLSWDVPDEGSSSVTEYRIYRRGETGDRQLIATVPAGTDTFVDGSVEAGAEYDYWVTAVNAAGEGPFSDTPVTGTPLAVITGEAEPGPVPMIALALGAIGMLVAAVAVVLVLRRK